MKKQRNKKQAATNNATRVGGLEKDTQTNVPSPKDRIRQRAYQISQARGGAPGCEVDDWLQAERELKEEMARAHAAEGRAGLKTRSLGTHGLRVSALGLGCMGMSDFYTPGDEGEAIATIHRAIELGLTRLSLLEGAQLRKSLKIRFWLSKVCSHFPALLSP
jgi:hypothetical protein